MAETIPPATPLPGAPQWDQDLVYAAICDPTRRHLLSLLAAGKPMTALELSSHIKKKVDATRKHLEWLRSAGLVIMTERDQADERRWLYTLRPSPAVIATADGKFIDFGFCVLRL